MYNFTHIFRVASLALGQSIAPVPVKQPWKYKHTQIWANIWHESTNNSQNSKTKQRTLEPYAYFTGHKCSIKYAHLEQTQATYKEMWRSKLPCIAVTSLERFGVSNHRQIECFLKGLLKLKSNKTLQHRIIVPLSGEPTVTGGFTVQRASNADSVSNLWRHHGTLVTTKVAWDAIQGNEVNCKSANKHISFNYSNPTQKENRYIHSITPLSWWSISGETDVLH